MAAPGDGDSSAGLSPDELEVAAILLNLPDLILRRRGLHWGATRRRSAPVARSPDTPLSFPASSSELPPPANKPAKKSQVAPGSACRDSRRIDSQLESMVRLQSSNADLPLDLNKPLAETTLLSSEKSGDELESMVRLQSDSAAGLLLDLNALPPENSLPSSPGESSDQLAPERSHCTILDLNLPVEESPAAELSDDGRR